MTDAIPKRQAAFRADYRSRIARFYSGPAHMVMILAMGLSTIWYCLMQIQDPAWYDWLIIPTVFVDANLLEWWIHKYVMHRPIKGFGGIFMAIYERHTLAHHQFFNQHEPTMDNLRDCRILLFSPYALVAFVVIAMPPAAAFYFLGLENIAWLLMATSVFIYLNYETFHFCCHAKDDRIIRYIPFINTSRRHHLAHHHLHVMMEKNFNVTYPFADWLFRSSDLKRGVLGHLLNGYSEKHLKAKPRRIIGRADDPEAGRVQSPDR